MNQTIQQLLNPEVLHTVDSLELTARIIVEGFMSGSNRSQAIGTGQEFSQYRGYEPGDDLRQLDWKMYARSERYYIKQADIETNITVKFVLDASHSMSYAEEGFSKFHYAKILIAALAYLTRKQGDAFGLFTVNQKKVQTVLPRFEQQQFMRFLHELIHAKSESTWNDDAALTQLYDHSGRELVIFMTDLYDDSNDLYRFISRLKTTRNEVIVFHLLGQQEQDLSLSGSFMFEDLETGARLKTNASTHRKQYAENVQHWIQASRDKLLEKQVNYKLVMLHEAPENVLRNFLIVRKNLMR